MIHSPYQRYFTLFCLWHICLWVMIPWCCRHNLPFDTVEGIAWGLQWQLGYDKHPPLAPWITAISAMWYPSIPWSVYIMAQLVHVSGLWALWRLAQNIFKAEHALIAVMLLEGIWYYNILTPKFNPNTMMMPMWALALLAVYRACDQCKRRHWFMAGVCLGLTLLTKYQSALLVCCAYAYSAICLDRARLISAWGWMSLAMGLIMAPNLIYIQQHDWLPVSYALSQIQVTTSSLGWLKYLWNPLDFLLEQIGAMAMLLLLLPPLLLQPKEAIHVNHRQKTFILLFAWGPLLLSCLLTVFTSITIYAKWGAPYLLLVGFVAVLYIQPKLTTTFLKKYLLWVLMVMTGTALFRGVYLNDSSGMLHQRAMDAHFPGQDIARLVNQIWRERSKDPLPYVVGSRYLVAHITTYTPNKPIPMFDVSLTQSPWVDLKDIQTQGAMVALWPRDVARLKALLKQQFTNVTYLGDFEIKRYETDLEKYQTIYLGYIPPKMINNQVLK